MSGIIMVIVCIALVIIGLILGWTIRWLYARFQLSASEQRAERVLQEAIKEAEAQKKDILLESTRTREPRTEKRPSTDGTPLNPKRRTAG